MTGLTFPEHHGQYKELKESIHGIYSDFTLWVNTSKHNKNIKITFIGCFPTSLGPLQFNYADDGSTVIIGDATFRYSYFKLDRSLSS